METNVNYTIVGFFVIVLLAAITMTIIWLSAGFSFKDFTTYKVYMKESVSGLNIDSAVEYNGVNVGTVKSIQINVHNPQLVEVLLSIKSDTPITEGTKATLNTRGLTGITYIALQDKGLDKRPLVTLRGESYPVINTAPSLFLRWDTALNKVTESFHQVANAISSLLDAENQKSFKQTLVNLHHITDSLSANTQQMSTILNNTSKFSEELIPLLQNSKKAVSSFQNQTMPAANDTITNLNHLSTNLLEISDELKQNPSVLIRGKEQPAVGPGER